MCGAMVFNTVEKKYEVCPYRPPRTDDQLVIYRAIKHHQRHCVYIKKLKPWCDHIILP